MDLTQNPLACGRCGFGPIVAIGEVAGAQSPVCRQCVSPQEIEQAHRDAEAVQRLRARGRPLLLPES